MLCNFGKTIPTCIKACARGKQNPNADEEERETLAGKQEADKAPTANGSMSLPTANGVSSDNVENPVDVPPVDLPKYR